MQFFLIFSIVRGTSDKEKRRLKVEIKYRKFVDLMVGWTMGIVLRVSINFPLDATLDFRHYVFR